MLDLFTPGAYCRAVGGNLERPEIQAPVVRWLAWSINPDNGAGGAVRPWDKCRGLWDGAGLESFPWLHCRSLEDVDRLIDVGIAEKSPAIGLNIEDVVSDFAGDLEAVAERLERWTGPVHMATLGWIQNGQGWSALKRCVVALEINPDEVPAVGADVPGCIAHAFAEGLVNVTLMYGTKAPNAPEDYDLGICHSLYTADDITPTAEAWKLWDAPGPCEKLSPVTPPPAPPAWYEKPYATGSPVGPDKLPRVLFPPKAGKGTQSGDDVTAFKRAISRGGRLIPWSPTTWSPTYGDAFALGDGSGQVGKSGVRGFQRQTWPNNTARQTGDLDDLTYQALRRARISDPEAPHFGEPLIDATAVKLLRQASGEFQQDAKVAAWRVAVTDYCQRAEVASSLAWVYSQDRPFQGFGVEPEKYHRADCSAFAILAYFWGRKKSGLPVPDPSDYGFTGYGSTRELDDNPTVTSGNYLVGDLALYGGSGHVTICKRQGDGNTSRWSSFGGEPRPVERTLFYRSDFLKVVRPSLK